MQHKFVSIDRIFSKYVRDIGPDFSEDDIIEWTGEALDFIGTQRILEPYIAFLEVKNHMAPIPKNCLDIEGIARDNRWTESVRTNQFCPKKVIEEVAVSDTAPTVPVALDCKGTPVNAYDLAYYRPYFDFKYGYNTFCNTTCYKNNYTPVREATSTFFGSKIDNISIDRYKIIQGSILKFNFKSGYIAIGCKKSVLDPETGYPMIPESISHITAITCYISKKRAERDMDAGRQGAGQRVQYWSNEWDWYCGQASNNDKMIQGVDELQNFLDQRTQLIPKNDRYSNFFGNLAQPQDDYWGTYNREEDDYYSDTEETSCISEEDKCATNGQTIVKNITIINEGNSSTGGGGGGTVTLKKPLIGIAGNGGPDDPIVSAGYYENVKLVGLSDLITIKVDSIDMDNYGQNKSFDFNPATGRIDFTTGYEWGPQSSISVDLNQ